MSGNDEIAERLYTICARTDAAYVPQAAFALARIRGSRGDTDGVQQALTLVPPNSSAYPLARQHWAEHLAAQPRDTADLTLALQTAEDAGFSRRRRAELGVDIYSKALARVEESGPKPGERIGEVYREILGRAPEHDLVPSPRQLHGGGEAEATASPRYDDRLCRAHGRSIRRSSA